MIKNNTVRVTNAELAGFIKSIGTECQFISMDTETEVKMRKTGNPFLGAVKRSKRNGLVNVNFVASVERKVSELTGVPVKDITYTPGKTHYHHLSTEDGRPLALCESNKPVKATGKMELYLQYYPHRNLGTTTYWLKGVQLSKEQVKQMYTFVPETDRAEYKPAVLTFKLASIRSLRARRVNLLNATASKIADRLAAFRKSSAFEVNPANVTATPVPA